MHIVQRIIVRLIVEATQLRSKTSDPLFWVRWQFGQPVKDLWLCYGSEYRSTSGTRRSII